MKEDVSLGIHDGKFIIALPDDGVEILHSAWDGGSMLHIIQINKNELLSVVV